MEPDASKSDWGWAPSYWQNDVGDVVLVRLDGQDLTVSDAELLCRFCEWKLQPLFEDGLGAGLVQRSRREVVDFITAENMASFRNEMERRKAEDTQRD